MREGSCVAREGRGWVGVGCRGPVSTRSASQRDDATHSPAQRSDQSHSATQQPRALQLSSQQASTPRQAEIPLTLRLSRFRHCDYCSPSRPLSHSATTAAAAPLVRRLQPFTSAAAHLLQASSVAWAPSTQLLHTWIAAETSKADRSPLPPRPTNRLRSRG